MRLHRSQLFDLIAPAVLIAAMVSSARAQIVAFGASNVSGWNVAPQEKFSAQLQSMLRTKGYNVRVLNAGVYGNTTEEMRARMESDIPDGTMIVILDMSGGPFNDRLKGIDREKSQANMAAIKDRLTARGIKIVPISGADLGPLPPIRWRPFVGYGTPLCCRAIVAAGYCDFRSAVPDAGFRASRLLG